jgi:hypothetical protein
MASVPPESTLSVNPLPWEARQTRGAFPAFIDTLGLFFSHPAEAWARTRESGDLSSPLLFGTIVAWLSFAVQALLRRFIMLPTMLPGSLGRRLGALEGYSRVGIVFHLIFAPVFIVIALFIGAAILHVCCLITGALSTSFSGFEGSFRAVAYSEVSALAGVIPVVGGFLAVIWWIVLAVMGIQRMHRTTQGKAIVAVLIPVVFCCGALVVLVLAAGTAFLMRGPK